MPGPEEIDIIAEKENNINNDYNLISDADLEYKISAVDANAIQPELHEIDENGVLRSFLEEIVNGRKDANVQLSYDFAETIEAVNTMVSLKKNNLLFDDSNVEPINNVDKLRDTLDDFNQKTDYSFFSDPRMSEIYTSLRYIQNVKNEYTKYSISKKSSEIQAENKELADGYLDKLSIDFEKLSDSAKKANFVFGPVSEEQKNIQNQILENIENNASVLLKNKTRFDNAQKEMAAAEINTAENENEIKAFKHLKNVAKLQHAMNTLIKTDPNYIKTKSLLDNFKKEKELLQNAKTNPRIKFTDHTRRKHYKEFQLINENLDKIFADPDEVDQKANDVAYVKIKIHAKEIFPDKTDEEIKEKLKTIEEIYEKDIDEVKDSVNKAMEAFEKKYDKNSEYEAKKIAEDEKNISLFETRLSQIVENGKIEKAGQFNTLKEKRANEINRFANYASKTTIGAELSKRANVLKGKDVNSEGMASFIDDIDNEINKRELKQLVNQNVEKTNDSQKKYANLNNNVAEYLKNEKHADSELQKVKSDIKHRSVLTDKFVNKNPEMQKVQERAKKLLETMDLGKRAGHSNSKEFENMKSTLKNFAENPNEDNYKEMTAAAEKYKTEKANGRHFKLFTTAMRAKRLNSAEEILSIGEQFNSVNTQIKKEKNALESSKQTLDGLNPEAGVQAKLFSEKDIATISNNQKLLNKDLENSINNAVNMKNDFVNKIHKGKVLSLGSKPKENTEREIAKF